MEEYELIGKIVKDENTRYRIIHYAQDNFVLCQLDISFLNLLFYPKITLNQDIRNKRLEIEEEEFKIVDIELLSDKQKAEFLKKKQIVSAIEQVYGPSFMNLMGKAHKKEFDAICNQYQISRYTAWKYLRNYLQGGSSDYSLMDRRIANPKSRVTEYHYQRKTGRPSSNIITGVILTHDVKYQFSQALNEYKKNREMTFSRAYIWLLQRFYQKSTTDSASLKEIKPISETPTYQQFLYYCNKHLSEKEKRILKTSATEERNDHRLLTGTSSANVSRPGWVVEVDALEADCSLISEEDANQCVGRPIVYMMIDCYSRAIVAFSVSFNNNSMIALSNLFLNLIEDKKEFLNRNGFTIDEGFFCPPSFMPHEVRCDRGSDFKSDQFSTICKRLGINRTLVPGGSGSMKGLIEKSFRDFHTEVRPDLAGKGLITKRYDSKHHQQAELNITRFTQLVIAFVGYHNNKSMVNYPMNHKLLMDKTLVPTPSCLWKYGCDQFGEPTRINPWQREQMIYDLMPTVTATLSKKGLFLLGLYYYIPDDKELLEKVYKLANKSIKKQVRIDPRYVGTLYYQSNNTLYKAHMNPELSGDEKYAEMSLVQLKEFDKLLKEKKSAWEAYNIVHRVAYQNINKAIIKDSLPVSKVKTQNIQSARAVEKNRTNIENRLGNYFETPPVYHIAPQKNLPTENEKHSAPIKIKSIYEAIDQFDEEEEENFNDV